MIADLRLCILAKPWLSVILLLSLAVPGEAADPLRGFDLQLYLRAAEEGAIKFTALGADLFPVYLWLTLVLGYFSYTKP